LQFLIDKLQLKHMKQKTSFTKSKAGTALGFRTPDFFKQGKFGGKAQQAKFNPVQFKIQHKGGS
jgi:hypothetical protein